MKSCVVGIGAMGVEMALHIKNKGQDVIGIDVNLEQVESAKKRGLPSTLDLISEVPNRDVFIVIVATDAQSASVVGQILDNNPKPGSAIVIAGTNHPDTMKSLSDKCVAKQIRLVDAPVVFGMQGARDGNLASLCGGTAEDVEYVTPVLMCYSRAVHHVGAVGTGQLAKTCNNMMHWAACCANFEVLALAKRYGVDAQRMREILLQCPAKNTTLERWDNTRFTWQEKDMDVAMDLAQTASLPLPLFGTIDQLVKMFKADDVSALLYGEKAHYLGVEISPLNNDD
ncbi:NAD(P)-dependent oxidoreductase [Litorivicinus sp.]|jgi:3-hydroxyisobutyrate dehydrogenase|nr:NAD(P)-dependent oxidoreductase [Litorivicinus sp.]MDC1240596.1 NAD(P)-dependent oxidoreductase [Litorivicinus sp.]